MISILRLQQIQIFQKKMSENIFLQRLILQKHTDRYKSLRNKR